MPPWKCFAGKCEEHIHDTANIRICVLLCVVLSGAVCAYIYVRAPASVHESSVCMSMCSTYHLCL